MKLSEARALATELMIEHGLTERGWRFEFDQAKRRFGCCHYGLKRITMSVQLTSLNDERHVKNTILHEIAHALAGNAAGHGYLWKAQARAIGCNGERCYSSEVIKPTPAFKGTCPNCKRVIYKHRRNNIACGQCCKRHNNNCYSDEYRFTWERA